MTTNSKTVWAACALAAAAALASGQASAITIQTIQIDESANASVSVDYVDLGVSVHLSTGNLVLCEGAVNAGGDGCATGISDIVQFPGLDLSLGLITPPY